MNNLEQERIDGAMLVGFNINKNTLSTRVDDSMGAQELYCYLEPVAEYRSIDEPDDDYILSWRPYSELYPRVREWREDGFIVPEDVSISEDTLSLLASVNASEYETDEGEIMEMSLPPMSKDGSSLVKQELICRHGIIAIGGYGIEPLRLDEEATETIHRVEDKPLQKS